MTVELLDLDPLPAELISVARALVAVSTPTGPMK